MGYHIKDANRTARLDAPPAVGPYTQTTAAPGLPAQRRRGRDLLARGPDRQGLPRRTRAALPDPNVIGFRRMFTEVRSHKAKGFKYHIIESDGPGRPRPRPPTRPIHDPGRSLRLAKVSARNLLGLK